MSRILITAVAGFFWFLQPTSMGLMQSAYACEVDDCMVIVEEPPPIGGGSIYIPIGGGGDQGGGPGGSGGADEEDARREQEERKKEAQKCIADAAKDKAECRSTALLNYNIDVETKCGLAGETWLSSQQWASCHTPFVQARESFYDDCERKEQTRLATCF